MAVELTPARLQAALFGAREALKRVFPEMEPHELAVLLALLTGGAIAEAARGPIAAVQLEVLMSRLLLNAQAGATLFFQLAAESDD